jgi:CBS domain-containing protein
MNDHTGAARNMYRFLESTVHQYMTRAVTTVTRQTTMRELEALTRLQFVPRSGKRKDVGDRYKIRFSSGFCVHRSDGAPIRPVDATAGRRNDDRSRVHVEPSAPLTRVLQLMVSLKSRSFPVIGLDHQLVGIISRKDVIRALKETTQDD